MVDDLFGLVDVTNNQLFMVVSSRMFPNRYMGNGMEITKHPFKTGCLEFQVMTSQPNPPGNVPSPRNKAL